MTSAALAAVESGRYLRGVGQNVAGLVGAVLIWEFACRAGLLPMDYVPPPTDVAAEIGREIFTQRWWLSTGRTLSNWFTAVAIGAATAIPIGILLGSSEYLYRAFRVPFEFLRAVPPVALIPVVVLVAGATPSAAIFLAAYGCVWPLLVQTIYGLSLIHISEPMMAIRARALETLRPVRMYGAVAGRIRWRSTPDRGMP